MLLQSYFVLLPFSVRLCLCQEPTSTITGLPDNVHIAAIIPTETGQVGITPVDIPSEDQYAAPIGVDTDCLTVEQSTTKWIGVNTVFGTVTTTATNDGGKPKETTIPEGFRVALNAEGKLDITFSKFFKDKIAKISAELPSCSVGRVKRDLGSRRRHERLPKRQIDTGCVRQRTTALVRTLREDPEMMGQMSNLEAEIARVTGNDAIALEESGQMMGFASEGGIDAMLVASGISAGAESASLMGILGSIALFFGASDSTDDVWKLEAEPKVMPLFKGGKIGDEDKDCPNDLACAGQRCVGDKGKCTAEWKGCECAVSCDPVGDAFIFSKDQAAVDDEITQFVFGSDPDSGQKIPQPDCGPIDKSSNLVDLETDVWGQLLDDLCVGKKELTGPLKTTKKTKDIGVDSYSDWTFDFTFETTRKNACTAYSCVDVFGKFMSCTSTSHSKYQSGEIKLDCGTAKYSINDPAAEDTDNPGPRPTPKKPKTDLKMQNGKCWGRDDFGDHGKIEEYWLRSYTGWACAGTGLKTIKAGDKSTFISWSSVTNNTPYQYNIFWQDGCELKNGHTEAYASNPLEEKKPGYTKCQEILFDNYKRCKDKNGGVGGSIQAGCLVYEFKVEKK